MVLTGLAAVLTAHIMTPVFERTTRTGEPRGRSRLAPNVVAPRP